MLGLTGAHRTGKSTLAREYAKKVGAEFLETPVSSIFKELGYDPAKTYDFPTRMMIQEEVLQRVDALYATAAGHNVVTDRTPMCMLAYATAEAIGDTVPEDCQERFRRYMKSCFDVVNRRFHTLIVVQPGLPIVPAEGKAAPNLAYIEHLNALVRGFCLDERVKPSCYYVPRTTLDLAKRVDAVEFAVSQSVEKVNAMKRRLNELGKKPH